MTTPSYYTELGSFPEKATVRFTGEILDDAGSPIPGSALDTCTLLLYDKVTGQEVAPAIDVKASVNASAQLDYKAAPALIGILTDQPGRLEQKIGLLRWTYNGGADAGWHEYRYSVYNQVKVS